MSVGNVEVFENVECKAETDMAILVDLYGDEKWIPKSVIADESEVIEKGDIGELVVSRWFAEKELA